MTEYSIVEQNKIGQKLGIEMPGTPEQTSSNALHLIAGGRQLSVPLTREYIDVAITLLSALRGEIAGNQEDPGEANSLPDHANMEVHSPTSEDSDLGEFELGSIEQLGLSGEA